MDFYQSKTIASDNFEELKQKVISSLQSEGFGILTEIDLQATLKNKLGKEYKPHVILGACNPSFADRALGINPNISVMLPCNVTIKQLENNTWEIASINPVSSIGMIENESLSLLAKEVQGKLKAALEKI